MRLARRVLAAERALGLPLVTAAEFHAAAERLRVVLTAKLEAMALGKPEPQYDRAGYRADCDLTMRWRRQQGMPEPDHTSYQRVEATLLAEARRISQNPAWTWSDARRRAA